MLVSRRKRGSVAREVVTAAHNEAAEGSHRCRVESGPTAAVAEQANMAHGLHFPSLDTQSICQANASGNAASIPCASRVLKNTLLAQARDGLPRIKRASA